MIKLTLMLVLIILNLVLTLKLILVAQVLTYQGEEMEEDDETMADYDIQVDIEYTMLTIFHSKKIFTPNPESTEHKQLI